MVVVLPHIPTCSVRGVAWKKCHVSEKCNVSGFGPYPHLLCAWLVAWKNAMLVQNAMLVVLPHIPTCSVRGVAWKKCHVSEKCYGSGFAPFSHLLCEWLVAWKNAMLVQNAMLVVLPHIPTCSVRGVAWKKCHVSEKCYGYGSDFAPFSHLLCAWCRLKKMPC